MLVRLLRSYLRPYRKWLAIIVAAQALQAIAALFLPTINADIIDYGVIKGNVGYIIGRGALMLVIAVAQTGFVLIAVYFGSRTAMAAGRDIRQGLFSRVQSFSAREVGRFGAPSLITRTTNDVQQVQMLVLMTLIMVLSAPVMGIGAMVMALHQNVPLTGLLLVVVPLLGIIVTIIISRMRPLFRVRQDRLDSINRIMREQITGIRVIRAFVRDEPERQRFQQANTELYDVSVGTGWLMGMMFPLVMTVVSLASVAVLWFGGHLINDGSMQVGALVAFLSYLMQVLMAVMMSTFMFMMLPRADVSADRIMDVLNTDPSVKTPVVINNALPAPGVVELRNVEFRYPGAEEPVLRDINVTARPGEITAFIGSTGSGKTTLLNLIPRLFDATAGAVLVGGTDVRELDPETLAGAVAIVPQQAYLFSGTVRSTLRYGRPDATDEELWRALEIAQASGFITDLDAPVSQGGTNFSGGQRQRLAIARALVHQAGIYLFDDSFSALDYATDAALRAELARRTEGATVLIVAQRVSTIRHADQIVVLETGRVAGIGTHDELMAANQTYREIVLSQLTEQEAAA